MCVETLCRVLQPPAPGGEVAVVDVDGVTRQVSLALLILDGVEVRAGDWLLTHTGLGLRVLTAVEAAQLHSERSAMFAGTAAAEETQP